MSVLIKNSKSTDSADCAAKIRSMDRLISGIWQDALVGSNELTLAAFTLWATVGVLWGSVEAQPHKDPARIGFLASSSGERLQRRIRGFQQGLREFGHEEGKHVRIEYRSAAGKFDRLPGLAAELVRLPVDILVAEGAPAAHAAKNATQVIPIVIGNAADPVRTGLVASLASPGGNVTGLSDFNFGVVTKRLELLKEIAPSAYRIAVLVNPGNPTNPIQLKELSNAAPVLSVTLVSFDARKPEDIDTGFAAIVRQGLRAVIVFGDPMFGTHQRRLTELTIKARLPAIYGASESVEGGGLMSYGTNFPELYRRAAIYVDKILKGAKPADLPVEQPTKFEFVINLKTANQIGLVIPAHVLARADRVIR